MASDSGSDQFSPKMLLILSSFGLIPLLRFTRGLHPCALARCPLLQIKVGTQ